jgi:hypothetical protein
LRRASVRTSLTAHRSDVRAECTVGEFVTDVMP